MVETSLETCLLGANCKLTLDRPQFTVCRLSLFWASNDVKCTTETVLSLGFPSFPGRLSRTHDAVVLTHEMTRVYYFTECHAKLCWSEAEAYEYSFDPTMSLSGVTTVQWRTSVLDQSPWNAHNATIPLEFVSQDMREALLWYLLHHCQDWFGGRGRHPLPPSLLHVCPSWSWAVSALMTKSPKDKPKGQRHMRSRSLTEHLKSAF